MDLARFCLAFIGSISVGISSSCLNIFLKFLFVVKDWSLCDQKDAFI